MKKIAGIAVGLRKRDGIEIGGRMVGEMGSGYRARDARQRTGGRCSRGKTAQSPVYESVRAEREAVVTALGELRRA